jgi:hypothetical protein
MAFELDMDICEDVSKSWIQKINFKRPKVDRLDPVCTNLYNSSVHSKNSHTDAIKK